MEFAKNTLEICDKEQGKSNENCLGLDVEKNHYYRTKKIYRATFVFKKAENVDVIFPNTFEFINVVNEWPGGGAAN